MIRSFLTLFAAKLQGQEVNIPEVSAGSLFTNVLNVVYFVTGAVAVVMMILAGYYYLTANGDPQRAQRGMHTIIYGAIGLVVVIFAFAITNYIAGGAAR